GQDGNDWLPWQAKSSANANGGRPPSYSDTPYSWISWKLMPLKPTLSGGASKIRTLRKAATTLRSKLWSPLPETPAILETCPPPEISQRTVTRNGVPEIGCRSTERRTAARKRLR